MAFLIGGANSLTGGYNIENSLRSDGSTTELTRTPGSETNRETFTFSCWHKSMSSTSFFSCESDSNTKCVLFNHGSSQGMRTWNTVSGSTATDIRDAAYYRDPSSWYHSVWAIDTTDGTEANRVKMYVNGQAITVRSGYDNYPSEDEEMGINQAAVHTVGARTFSGETNYLDGYLADVCFIDGQQLAPSSFGETDEDSGIWKPKDAKDDLTFGSNGLFLEFGTSGTLGEDTSGNSDDLTSTNLAAIDQTTDTPTNNWCTINIRSRRITSSAPTHAEGNTKITSASANTQTHGVYGSIGDLKSGKWYYEAKPTLVGTDGTMSFGFGDTDARASDTWGSGTSFNAYVSNGSKRKAGTDTTDWGDTFDDDDIISVAIDLDNGAIYFAKNGTWQDSGDPTSGATKTGAAYTDIVSAMPAGGYVPASRCIRQGGGDQEVVLYNYGNPAFAISSSQADDNGYGNFEYDVPAGYYALCTKNLAEFG